MGEKIIKRNGRGFGGTPPTDPLAGNYQTYNAAVNQNAEDYDSIMQGYKGVLEKNQNNLNPSLFKDYQPQQYQYSSSPQQQESISNLGGLSQSGGYSQADIADLRARGISPIRAIYANAKRNIDRQRTLQGGYSPNYTAATAKMAREEGALISDKTTDINAGIADKVAQGRLGIAGTYASAAGNQSDTANRYGRANIEDANEAAKFNAANKIDLAKLRTGSDTSALQGMTSLYGTTPALASTFGNQALNAAQMQSNNINSTNQATSQAIGSTLTRKPVRQGGFG